MREKGEERAKEAEKKLISAFMLTRSLPDNVKKMMIEARGQMIYDSSNPKEIFKKISKEIGVKKLSFQELLQPENFGKLSIIVTEIVINTFSFSNRIFIDMFPDAAEIKKISIGRCIKHYINQRYVIRNPEFINMANKAENTMKVIKIN